MRRTSARLVLNLSALNEVQLALAEGLFALEREIAEDAAAHVHYATDPRHIREEWGYATFANRRKIGDASSDGTATAKPRASTAGDGLSGYVGFGFPARFEETGTSDTPSHPFLTPAVERVVPRAVAIVRAGAAPRLSQP